MPFIKLKHPIKGAEGKDIKQVEVAGVLRVKHLHLLPTSLMQAQADGMDVDTSKFGMADMMPLVASLCGLTTEEADELSLEDFKEIMEAVKKHFFDAPASQATGSK